MALKKLNAWKLHGIIRFQGMRGKAGNPAALLSGIPIKIQAGCGNPAYPSDHEVNAVRALNQVGGV